MLARAVSQGQRLKDQHVGALYSIGVLLANAFALQHGSIVSDMFDLEPLTLAVCAARRAQKTRTRVQAVPRTTRKLTDACARDYFREFQDHVMMDV